MQYFKQLTLGCLVASMSCSSFMVAESKHHLKEELKQDAKAIADLKEVVKQQKKEEAKSNLLAGLGIIAIGGALAAWANQNFAFLQDTGLGVGIGAFSICLGLSYISPENSQTLVEMGIAAPFLAMLGQAIQTDAVSGPKGFIAQYGALGLDKLAITADGSKSAAFSSLVTIGAYVAVKPKLNQFTSYVSQKFPGSRNYSENEND